MFSLPTLVFNVFGIIELLDFLYFIKIIICDECSNTIKYHHLKYIVISEINITLHIWKTLIYKFTDFLLYSLKQVSSPPFHIILLTFCLQKHKHVTRACLGKLIDYSKFHLIA